ncbi:leucine Rich Repeat domain-containing protein [Purpureocillium lavendulum]|uniref:Leucine Rich Repeat domain-containing protein n=1 Tax=Purpureocillium lavendulum TaxID=1247861 RepID=A0AB34FKJ7_9HYPO|nr:leucine Rich Repeat domain-containing protein [Purpureocillium lavendulum]
MAVPNGAGPRRVLDFDTSMMIKSSMARALSPSDTGSRSSFSSVRENDDGLAQTFTRSKVSSYIDAPEDVFDESPTNELAQPNFQPPLTQPQSRLHGFWFPSESFKGWKQIPIKGKPASRSCEDLRKFCMTWDNAPQTQPKKQVGSISPGDSPLEQLPSEVLGAIIDLLVVEIPPNGLTTRNTDLMSLLLTSRAMHAATLTTLYRHITIPHSRIFRKFLATINKYPALATIVRRMDFSHFNPSFMFSTASERAKARNLTAETLTQCLDLMPYLQEFLAQEYIDDDLGPEVLRKLLFGMPQLRALDICGCSSTTFKNSFKALLDEPWPDMLPITRLSLHKCISLPPAVFEKLLPRLSHLTHLDVAGTHITDEALQTIPASARLTHLNLAKCKDLSAEVVIKFISTHPAASSLEFLSLAADASNHLLLGKDDVDALLPVLPPTLQSLSLRGSRMHNSHVPELIRLSQTLEELAVGRGLDMSDIHRIFKQDDTFLQHNLRYLDISEIDTIIGSASTLLAPACAPLSVIEIEERAYERAAKLNKSLEKVGWTASEFGSRHWLVRKPAPGTVAENPRRKWKMGAESWGMRKIPVAVAEVGGMYGSFMFGRRL